MIRDVQFGLLLAAVVVLALGQRILPRYADQSNPTPNAGESGSHSPLAQGAKPGSNKPAAEKPANILTTIFPDGYKDKKGAEAGALETELMPPTLPDGDVAQSPAVAAPTNGPVLPPDELSPPTDRKDVASGADEKSARDPGTDTKPKDDEIVTEFIPFTEPEPADAKADGRPGGEKRPGSKRVAPEVPSRQAMVAPNPFPKPDSQPSATPPGKREPVLFPGQKGGIRAQAGGTGPVDSAANDKPAIVQSFDIEDTGARETKSPDIHLAKRGKPVHPYFERYLDRKTYYTRSGDTLESIALSLYQDPAMADSLLKANARELKSASDLRPGMILRLP